MMQCSKCAIAKHRKNIVLGRGEKPADILFMGEAPGRSEDATGQAFVGKSGSLLNQMILDVQLRIGISKPPSYFIINTVLCRPCVLDENSKHYLANREPSFIEIFNCSANVTKIIEEVSPKVVVFVGKIAENYYKDEFDYTCRIYHPAFLLRLGGKSSAYYPTNLRIIEQAFRRIL